MGLTFKSKVLCVKNLALDDNAMCKLSFRFGELNLKVMGLTFKSKVLCVKELALDDNAMCKLSFKFGQLNLKVITFSLFLTKRVEGCKS